MPTKHQPLPVVHQLQEAIRTSGLSLNELGRRTGVSEGQLSRFLRGDRTLTLPAAARVCLYFGLRLCPQEERFTGGGEGNGDRASPSGKARTRRSAKRREARDVNVD
jgi:transcriptional regulator with XRE-family HTH domain